MLIAMQAGRLVDRYPLRQGTYHKRRLIVTQTIADHLDGKIQHVDFPHPEADVTLGAYLAGNLVVVSLEGRSAPNIELERLRDVDEVWTFCFRKPRPGWRLLGRFAAVDFFVGLELRDRRDFDDRSKYAAAIQQTITDWQTVLNGDSPIRGNTIGDYLTGAFLDADKEA